MSSISLSHQREKFVLQIFSGLSQRKAYRVAYPSSEHWKDSVVDVKASQLMADDKVKLRLQELRDEEVKETKYTKQWIMERFEGVFDKSSQAVPVMVYDRELGEYVETGEYKFDSSGANKALTEIGKLQGHYIEKVQLSGELDLKAIALRRHEERQMEKKDDE